MQHSLDELVPVLDRLEARIAELECRLSALENRTKIVAAKMEPSPAGESASTHPIEQFSLSRPVGAMAAVGKIFLGIAGAYLLRAVAESNTVPRVAIVPIAVAYATLWLVWAARVYSRSSFTSGAYAFTASLILSPMLWELTVEPRLKALTPDMTAALLVVFVAAASGLAWKRALTSVVWAPVTLVAATTLALLIATHNPVPFVLALLSMALVSEVAADAGRWPHLRAVPALAADLAAIVLIAVYTSQSGLAPDYPPVAAGVLVVLFIALFAISAGGMVVRTVVLDRGVWYFDVAQTAVAFGIASVGLLRAGHHLAAIGVGAFCLLAGAACYWVAFRKFEASAKARERQVFATFAAALLIVGVIFSLSPASQAVWYGLAALASIFACMRTTRLTLGFHAVAYLAAAVIVSGTAFYAGQMLVGALPSVPEWPVWIVAAAILLCSTVAWQVQGETWPHRVLRLACVALAMYVTPALLVAVMVGLTPGEIAGSAPRLAVVRTLVICLTALSAARIGSLRQRRELVWLAYVAMALCTLKLLFEDLRTGSASTIALSLFCYGLVWVLLSHLARAKRTRLQSHNPPADL